MNLGVFNNELFSLKMIISNILVETNMTTEPLILKLNFEKLQPTIFCSINRSMFICKLHCKAQLLDKNMFDVSINTSHTICRGFAHAEMSRGFTHTSLMLGCAQARLYTKLKSKVYQLRITRDEQKTQYNIITFYLRS